MSCPESDADFDPFAKRFPQISLVELTWPIAAPLVFNPREEVAEMDMAERSG